MAPHLLKVNEAVQSTNIDHLPGPLTPVKSAVITDPLISVDQYFTKYNSIWYSSSTPASFVEHQGILYTSYTDGTAATKRGSYGILPIGLITPVSASPIVAGAGTGLTGTYQYVYTYYDATDGTESAPSPVSIEVVVTNKSIDVPVIISTEAHVDNIRIYRVGGTIVEFSFVAEIANATATYSDSIADADLIGTLLDSDTNNPIPNNIQYFTEAYGELFGAVGDRLYHTKGVGNFNYWPATNFVKFPSTIIGITSIARGLIVWTDFETYILTGTNVNTFIQYRISDIYGCVSNTSVISLGDITLFVSKEGICSTNGSSVKLITKAKQNLLSLDVVDSTFYGDVYYIVLSDFTVVSLDMVGLIYTELTLSCNAIKSIGGILYIRKASDLYIAFSDPNLVETFTYLSPLLNEGSYVLPKTYKSIFIRSKGNITVKVYIDEELVMTKSYTTTDTHELKPPQSKQRGNSIQFQITGTGTVYEIDYDGRTS